MSWFKSLKQLLCRHDWGHMPSYIWWGEAYWKCKKCDKTKSEGGQ